LRGCCLRVGETAYADEQLYRAFERVADTRKRGCRCSLARRVERVDVEIACGEHRGEPAAALDPVRTDDDAFVE
jgi:hypothetical protein